ncbi:retrovirus-related pol polyprotein from transposon TNT 1-94 [Tanacetum coccineum]
MYQEYFTIGNQSVSKSSALSDNLQQQDTRPTLTVQPIIEPITPPTDVNAKENNKDQTEDAQFQPYEFFNPFCTSEELHQFDRLKVWELVDKPFGKTVINLKWLCKNKKDEDNTVICNKARLVAKGYKQEEGGVLCHQPDGFVRSMIIPEKVYRLRKSLYGLKQAPKAWYDELSTFLMSKGFTKGNHQHGTLVSEEFWFQLTSFSDADHVGCLDTSKSTSGGIQLLGEKLVSWMSKKQDCTTMSITKAEYVALSTSYAQVMWMRTHLKDYDFHYNRISLYCQSAIAISCNPVQHSRTKHINVHYHFIKEQVE